MSAAVWTCPVCHRKVPDRVPECYCGVRRDQALQHARSEEARVEDERPPRWPLLAVPVAGVVLAAVVAWPPQAATPPPAPVNPAPASAEPTSPPASTTQAARRAVWVVAPTAPAPAAVDARPAPEPAPTPVSSPPVAAETTSPIDTARSRGAEAFQVAAAEVVRRADDLRSRVREYSAQCRSSPQFVTTVGCDDVRHNLEGDLARIARSLDDAEDAARQAWVEPGTRRQIRGQLQVDDRIAQLQRLMAEAFAAQR